MTRRPDPTDYYSGGPVRVIRVDMVSRYVPGKAHSAFNCHPCAHGHHRTAPAGPYVLCRCLGCPVLVVVNAGT